MLIAKLAQPNKDGRCLEQVLKNFLFVGFFFSFLFTLFLFFSFSYKLLYLK